MKKENNFIAILSYLGILFLVPYFYNKGSEFVKHHAREGLRLFILNVIFIVVSIIILFTGLITKDCSNALECISTVSMTKILIIVSFIIISGVYEIIGIINVLRGNQKSLPLMKKSKEIVKCALVILSMFFVPSVIALILVSFIKSNMLSTILANLIYILLLVLIYKKDLIKEFKIFKEEFKSSFSIGFKYYFLGLGIMVISNLIINLTIGQISTNETLVRETIFEMPLYALLSVAIIAPITEEIVFRKSLRGIFNNKWFYAITCGVLFGLAHIVTLEFTIIDLVYVIPYGALGFAFGLTYYDTKNIYTPMSIHAMHNTLTYLLLIFSNSVGAL